MKLVFTSKERKQDFENAIKFLSSINRAFRTFWKDEIRRLDDANNKQQAEIVVREMLGALEMMRCLCWEDWFTQNDYTLLCNATDALVWSDFE